MARDGSGTTITFTSSAFSANLISVEGPTRERGDIPTSHMGTTDAETFIPTVLRNEGEVTLTLEHNGDEDPPIGEDPESIVIDWAGQGKTYTFDGYMKSYRPGAALGERMQATAVIKVTGEITEA